MTYEYTDPETGEIRKGTYVDIPMEEYYANVPFLRTPFNYNRDYVSNATGLSCPEPTRTQQQFKDDADINVIVERFGLTGDWPENFNMPTSDQFVESMDYHESLSRIREADAQFLTLPAHVREEFNNNPGELIKFLENPDNRTRAEKMGLVKPAPPPPAPPATPPATGGGVT